VLFAGFFLFLSRFLSIWVSLLVVCVCLSLSLSLASAPGSFIYYVLVVRVYVWVWPGVGYGVSGEFSRYYSTRGWGRLKTRSPFDRYSPEHAIFVTCLNLFWFSHWFDNILTLFLGLIYFFDQMLVCSAWGGGSWLNFFFLVVVVNCHYATQSRRRSRSRYRDPWMGSSLRPKLIALDFRKRSREKTETLGGNDICFRKPLSQTFSLIRLDFSESSRFPFFVVVSSPHICQLGTHTGGV